MNTIKKNETLQNVGIAFGMIAMQLIMFSISWVIGDAIMAYSNNFLLDAFGFIVFKIPAYAGAGFWTLMLCVFVKSIFTGELREEMKKSSAKNAA